MSLAASEMRTAPVLSEAAARLLAAIPDPSARDDARVVVEQALAALEALGRLHLPQDHFEVGGAERPADDKYPELAPYALAALQAINSLLEQVTARFAAPLQPDSEAFSEDDFDFDFDLVDEPPSERAAAAQQTDVGARSSPREQIAEAAHAYAGMVRGRVLQFAERLRFAMQQRDAWPLLAELDDGQRRLTKAVQGLLFGVLSVFGGEFKREQVYPGYRSLLSQSIALRSAIVELGHHVAKFNAAIAEADAETAVPLVVGIADRLNRFAEKPEYRTMRAEDKKAVMDFRRELHRLRRSPDGIPMSQLRPSVEGFSKFLEAMQAINHREVLVLHDRQRLHWALQQLDTMENTHPADAQWLANALQAVVQQLQSVQGRHPDLDVALRDALHRGVQSGQVEQLLPRWRMLLQTALTAV